LVAVVNIAVAAFLFVSFYAYQAGLNLEMGGRVGYGLASAVVQALGLAAYLIPSALLVVAGEEPAPVADDSVVGADAIPWPVAGVGIIGDDPVNAPIAIASSAPDENRSAGSLARQRNTS